MPAVPHSVSWVAMRTYATILCLLLTSVPVYAVDTLQVTTPDPGTEAWRWTEFDRTSGLGGEVRDITQDRDGSVWFATTQGAQRYDGHRWTTYTTKDGLPHNVITAVIQAEDGAMWFGTAAGIGRYDPSQPEERSWTVYTTADGLAYDFVPQGGLLQRRDGSIWASLWERIDAFAAPDGQAICRFDGRTWNTINQPEGLPLGRRLFEASDGAFWTLSGDGVFRLDGTAWTRYMPETASGVLRPLAILESPNGVFWVSFFRGGIGRLNPSSDEDGAWRMYTGLDGLPVLGSSLSVSDQGRNHLGNK